MDADAGQSGAGAHRLISGCASADADVDTRERTLVNRRWTWTWRGSAGDRQCLLRHIVKY